VTTGHKIVSNVFYYFFDFLTLVVGGYIYWVLMGKLLTPDQYGVLTAMLALFYVLMTLTITGFPESVPKLISELVKRGQEKAAGGIIKYSLATAAVVGVVFSTALFFASDFLSRMFYGGATMTVPLQMVALLLLTSNMGNAAKAVLQGLQKFKVMFVADVVGNVVKLAAAAGLVMTGWAFLGGATAWVLYFIVTAVICGFAALRTGLPAGDFDRAKFWRFSTISTASQFSYYLVQQAGVLMLALLMSAKDVGYFGVAALFGQVLTFIPSVISGAIFPNLSELWVEHKEKVQRLLMAALKISILTVLPFTALFAIACRPLIDVIYNSSYIGAAVLFPTYMVGSMLFGLVLLLMVTLYAIGRPAGRLAIISVGAGINIGLCFFLIPIFGIIGAAVAFLTSQVVALTAALFAVRQDIQFMFSRRSLWALPALFVFGAIVWLHYLTGAIWLKAVLVLVALTVYVLLLFATKVIGKGELMLLDYLPDKYGFGSVKRLMIWLVHAFDRTSR
jgi:stage V sporulation protein B